MEAAAAARPSARLAAEEVPKPTRNQKAKLRKKLLRHHRLENPAEGSHCSEVMTDLSNATAQQQEQQLRQQSQQQQQRQQQRVDKRCGNAEVQPRAKQQRLDPNTGIDGAGISANADSSALCMPCSVQPVQTGAQLSNISAGDVSELLQSGAAAVPGVGESRSADCLQQVPALAGALAHEIERTDEEPLNRRAAPVCRCDMSHAALLIGAALRARSASAAAVAAEDDDPRVEDALPNAELAVSGSQQQLDAPEPAALPGSWRQGRGGKRVYVFGNYHRYYGYRLGEAFEEDPRLAALERRWFTGKRCMDVGCNEGLVTLALAVRHGVRSMVGVDIDEALIKRACKHLRQERDQAAGRSHAARRGGTPAAERRAAEAAASALSSTWFVHGDVLASEGEPGSVDTITCLSVSKWVHLHHGDAGLCALFERFACLLALGGLLVLEPQPWRSYKSAAVKVRRGWAGGTPLPHAYFHRLDQLRLRPNRFVDLLCGELGFRLLRTLQVGSAARGFDRPMLIFRKERQLLAAAG